MGRDKQKSITVTIDDGLRVKSCSNEFETVWKKHAGEIEDRLLHEIIPLRKSTIHSIKQVFNNGRPIKLKGVTLPCPYGSSEVNINITPLNKMKLSLGAKILLEPTFTCTNGRQTFEDKHLEEISSTSATLAHGIRNPLNAIKGAVVYISEKYAGEKHLIQFIKIIEEEIARLDSFVAHYLSTSINQKTIAKIDVNSVLKKIEILISFQVKSRKIKSVFKYGSNAHVKINPFLIEQAILNVINNALEAMSRGGQVTITTECINRSGGKYALVEISDTGCGIAKGIPLVLSSKKGRGFGLLITYEILRSVHGHVEIRSRRGKGTIVRLYFPCV